jgi:hypothetical protein
MPQRLQRRRRANPGSQPSGPSPVGEPGRASDTPNPLKNVYFGEQHLHTANSPDAFAMGTRNTPDDAYNFCKGKAIKKIVSGTVVQKRTPYDRCAVNASWHPRRSRALSR